MDAIDLNCDLGEGAGRDAALLPLITSANIACGGHAGDRATMRATLALAQWHGVSAGAHPGYPDRANFGRRERAAAPAEVEALVFRQTRALARCAAERGICLTHVKLHGALYHQASRDPALAEAVARAVRALDPGLILFGLAGGELLRAGRALGLRVASEVFADRTYQADGRLTARGSPEALVEDESAAIARVRRMIQRGRVRATDGTEVPVRADTVGVHGDGPRAVALARRLPE